MEKSSPDHTPDEDGRASLWLGTFDLRTDYQASSVTETGDDDVAHLLRLDEESVMAVWRMYE